MRFGGFQLTQLIVSWSRTRNIDESSLHKKQLGSWPDDMIRAIVMIYRTNTISSNVIINIYIYK